MLQLLNVLMIAVGTYYSIMLVFLILVFFKK